MKNFTMTALIAALSLTMVASSNAQNISVSPFATRNLKASAGNDWRGGLKFDVAKSGNFKFGAVAATSTGSERPLYLGGAASYTAFADKKSGFELGPVVSYTAKFSDLRNISDAQWGIGVYASFKF